MKGCTYFTSFPTCLQRCKVRALLCTHWKRIADMWRVKRFVNVWLKHGRLCGRCCLLRFYPSTFQLFSNHLFSFHHFMVRSELKLVITGSQNLDHTINMSQTDVCASLACRQAVFWVFQKNNWSVSIVVEIHNQQASKHVATAWCES